jgi:hypothetical protein
MKREEEEGYISFQGVTTREESKVVEGVVIDRIANPLSILPLDSNGFPRLYGYNAALLRCSLPSHSTGSPA